MAEPPTPLSSREHTIEESRPTCREHRVEQKYPAILDVCGQLIVEQARLATLLISLDQDLANANTSAAFSECLLHGFTSAHDRHTAYLPFELHTSIRAAYRCSDRVRQDWQVVQGFLYQQPANSIAVENEVCPVGSPITDDAAFEQNFQYQQQDGELRNLRQERDQLRRLLQGM